MKKQFIVFVPVMIIVMLTIIGCGPTETPTPTETSIPIEITEIHKGQSLVKSYCVSCHSQGVVEEARYDREGWDACIERMILIGTILNPEQEQMIIEYLTLTFPKES